MALPRVFCTCFFIVAVATLFPLSKCGNLCQLRDISSQEDVNEYRECLLRAEIESPKITGKETSMSNHLPRDGNDVSDNFHTFSYCKSLSAEQCHSFMKILEYAYQSVAEQLEAPPYRFRRALMANLAAYNGLDSTMIDLLQHYYAWRQKKGYGKSVGRWGRSADLVRSRRQAQETSGAFYETPHDFYENGLDDQDRIDQRQPDPESSAILNLGRLQYKRWKTYRSLMNVLNGMRQKRSLDWGNLSMEQLKNNPQLMKMLYEYKAWRSKNGYGKLGGRYG